MSFIPWETLTWNWLQLTLTTFYCDKFSVGSNQSKSEVIQKATVDVSNKYSQLREAGELDSICSKSKLMIFIRKLKSGCSAGSDGILSEH